MNKFNSIRISENNLTEYLHAKFPTATNFVYLAPVRLTAVPQLLQRDYGKALDCTLTSITAVMMYYLPHKGDNEIYDEVEKVAEKYFYNGDKKGTNPIFIRSIMKDVAKHFGLKKSMKVRYLNGICFNFNSIKKMIGKKIPVIINIFKDGRKYYDDHSITITGYREIKVDGKTKKFLIVQDNWAKDYSYLDFDCLGMIASLNYAD